jgi:hypothetical protein
MTAARKSKAIRSAEEAALIAELQKRRTLAEAASAEARLSTRIAEAEARQRIRIAEVQTTLAWIIELKRIFLGPTIFAVVTAVWHALKK